MTRRDKMVTRLTVLRRFDKVLMERQEVLGVMDKNSQINISNKIF